MKPGLREKMMIIHAIHKIERAVEILQEVSTAKANRTYGMTAEEIEKIDREIDKINEHKSSLIKETYMMSEELID